MSTRLSFDDFIKDVTDAHIGLLDASKSLKSVSNLLQRSGHESTAQRLEQVQKDLDFALETMRKLDALYHTGKLQHGPRTPQIKRTPGPSGGMLTVQERPSHGRATRKLFTK